MDPAYITPFITSIQNVFSTMMQLPVTIGEPRIKDTAATTYDVSGIIGMSGDVVGSVVLSFPKITAQRLVTLFTGTEMTAEHADFPDAIGELANMVSGNAKGQFAGKKKVTISCPSVVIGQNHSVARPKDLPCIVFPCSTDCGEFVVEVAIAERPAPATAAPEAAKANA
jgi:chemotaxis protein CheX